MKQPGRKSAASMAVVPLGERSRQLAPADLTRDEAKVWNAVVAAESADWFSGSTRPLLAQYARHVVAARRVAAMINSLEASIAAQAAAGHGDLMTMMLGAVKPLDKLQRMQERESHAISTLATKMRISQQSTRNQRGNKIESRKPWEF
jgi:hypothetical protein